MAWGIEAQGLLGSPHGSLGPWTSMQPCTTTGSASTGSTTGSTESPGLDILHDSKHLTSRRLNTRKNSAVWLKDVLIVCVRNNRDTVSYHYHTSYHLFSFSIGVLSLCRISVWLVSSFHRFGPGGQLWAQSMEHPHRVWKSLPKLSLLKSSRNFHVASKKDRTRAVS